MLRARGLKATKFTPKPSTCHRKHETHNHRIPGSIPCTHQVFKDIASNDVRTRVNLRPVGMGRTVARATFQSFTSAISRTPRAGTGGGLDGGRASQSA